MNLKKVFNFIKEKRGYNIPLKYKLINGLPLSEYELNVEGDLLLNYDKKIKSLPNNLNIERDLYCYFCDIKSLPDNLYVGRNLNISYNDINAIPDNLYVGGYLVLHNTPLSKKYDEEEIRKMIEDKGGYVKARIYV